MSPLPRSDKPENDYFVGKPSNFPLGITMVELETGKVFQYRVGIPQMRITIRQDWAQLSSDVYTYQQLMKTATNSRVSPNLIIMSGNSESDKGRNYHTFDGYIVAHPQARIRKRGMEKAIIQRSMGTSSPTVKPRRYIRKLKVECELVSEAILGCHDHVMGVNTPSILCFASSIKMVANIDFLVGDRHRPFALGGNHA